MSSTRVNGRSDPPPVQRDVVVTKVVQIDATTSDSGYNLTYQNLSGAIPTCFDMVRVVKISVWGASDSEYVQITLQADGAQFSDYGTSGHKRPQVHVSPAFVARQTWNKASSTDVIASFITLPANSRILLQITAEFRSTASGQ